MVPPISNDLFTKPQSSLSELDSRAREIFRQVVETYLETGEPVGSRTLSRSGVALSPASIRNTMQDLVELGLLSAPHTSGGRWPTHQGLRLFVDGLLEIGDVGAEDKRDIEARLGARGLDFEGALREASRLLSGLAGGAGLVMTPKRDAAISQVEFVSLSTAQVLVVLVYEDGRVENRLMPQTLGASPKALSEAAAYLGRFLRGRTVSEARAELASELDADRLSLDAAAAGLIEAGLAAWAGDGEDGGAAHRALIVRGRANLIAQSQGHDDLERIRTLFEDLEQKQELIGLLDDVSAAEGVRIFIGAESRLFSLSASAVVAAPYMSAGKNGAGPSMIGAIGVIGPTRLNYARIIPLVDYTARILSRRLES